MANLTGGDPVPMLDGNSDNRGMVDSMDPAFACAGPAFACAGPIGGMGGSRGSKGPKRREDDDASYTTVMLRNIPNKYTQKMLIDQLHKTGFQGQIDYLYLPIDFSNRCNCGYCFINFRMPAARQQFTQKFDGIQVQQCLPGFNSYKVCNVTRAKWQGREENVRRLRSGPELMAQLSLHPEWLPLLLDDMGNEEEFPLENVSQTIPVSFRRQSRKGGGALGFQAWPGVPDGFPMDNGMMMGRGCKGGGRGRGRGHHPPFDGGFKGGYYPGLVPPCSGKGGFGGMPFALEGFQYVPGCGGMYPPYPPQSGWGATPLPDTGDFEYAEGEWHQVEASAGLCGDREFIRNADELAGVPRRRSGPSPCRVDNWVQ